MQGRPSVSHETLWVSSITNYKTHSISWTVVHSYDIDMRFYLLWKTGSSTFTGTIQTSVNKFLWNPRTSER